MPDGFNPTELITTKEAAALTEYSPVTLRQFAREGRIEGVKRGRDCPCGGDLCCPPIVTKFCDRRAIP